MVYMGVGCRPSMIYSCDGKLRQWVLFLWKIMPLRTLLCVQPFVWALVCKYKSAADLTDFREVRSDHDVFCWCGWGVGCNCIPLGLHTCLCRAYNFTLWYLKTVHDLRFEFWGLRDLKQTLRLWQLKFWPPTFEKSDEIELLLAQCGFTLAQILSTSPWSLWWNVGW